MTKTRLVTICVFLSLAMAPSSVVSQQSASSTTHSDPWIASLPTGEIVVGNLTPRWGSLTREAQAPSGGTTGGSAVTDPRPHSQDRGGGAGSKTSAGSGNGRSSTAGRSSSDAGLLSPAAGSAVDAEPNDSFGKAQPAAASCSVSGAINPARDVDWYSFEIPRRGAIEVRFSNVAAGLDIQYSVHNADNHDLTGWRQPKIGGGAEPQIVDLAHAGRYYLIVGDRSGKAEAAGYRVQWTYRSGDRYEPNESFGAATPIDANGAVAISTYPLRDVDWFVFEAANQGIATVRFEGVPAELDVAFTIHNGENQDLTGWITPKIADRATAPTIVDLPGEGRYYLVVADGTNDARSGQPYTLRLKTELGDAHEPNPSIGKATPIPASGSVQTSILPKGDVDVFRLEVDNQGILEIACQGVPQDIDAQVAIHNADNHDLTGWIKPKVVSGSTETVVVDLPAPGGYYLFVGNANLQTRNPTALVVTTKFIAGDEHEPNASVGQARPMSLGASVSANLLPMRDADWYVVDVPRPGTLEVQVSSVADPMDPAISVHNFENQDLTGWRRPKVTSGTTEVETVKVKDAGRYYVIIADDGGDDRVREKYSLTVRLK